MKIHAATAADLPAITEIYNEIILPSFAIYSDNPVSVEARTGWWKDLIALGYPVLVAEEEGTILGFASFANFRNPSGYRTTVEATIHLRPEARRKGVGSRLLDELIATAKTLGKHMLIAGVDSENLASIGFLEARGFQQAGLLREVGHKWGTYRDLVFLQLRISDELRISDNA